LEEMRKKYRSQKDELELVETMAVAVHALGHAFRNTRNKAAHPDVPRVPDETTASCAKTRSAETSRDLQMRACIA